MVNELATYLIEEDNFQNAWYKAITFVINQGTELVISGTEHRKPIKDSCMLISLSGNAIRQIENKEIHPQYPFKRVDEYCKEFSYEYLRRYYNKPESEQFSYLYFERLVNYKLLDQLQGLRSFLAIQRESNITSNRLQAITWIPEMDFLSNSPPCLQRVQIRYIPNNKVDVHLTWRSRDLYTAWQSNIICLIDMLNREVIKHNDCQIIRIIDYSDSLHIYKTDLEEAKNVGAVNI